MGSHWPNGGDIQGCNLFTRMVSHCIQLRYLFPSALSTSPFIPLTLWLSQHHAWFYPLFPSPSALVTISILPSLLTPPFDYDKDSPSCTPLPFLASTYTGVFVCRIGSLCFFYVNVLLPISIGVPGGVLVPFGIHLARWQLGRICWWFPFGESSR